MSFSRIKYIHGISFFIISSSKPTVPAKCSKKELDPQTHLSSHAFSNLNASQMGCGLVVGMRGSQCSQPHSRWCCSFGFRFWFVYGSQILRDIVLNSYFFYDYLQKSMAEHKGIKKFCENLLQHGRHNPIPLRSFKCLNQAFFHLGAKTCFLSLIFLLLY